MTKFCEEAVVAGSRQVAPGHYLVTLGCAQIAAEAKPGQFALLRSSLPGMPLLSRPFSIYGVCSRSDRASGRGTACRAPTRGFTKQAGSTEGQVEFLVKVVGRTTELLCSQEPGAQMLVVGPLGRPFQEPRGKEVLLIGGGTGVAPLAFFAQRMAERMPMHAIIGAPSAEYVLGRDRLLDAGVGLTAITEDGSEGEKGLPTEVLAQMLPREVGSAECRVPPLDLARGREPVERQPPTPVQSAHPPQHSAPGTQHSVLACGPTGMLVEVARICGEAGVECQVSLENQLGCGVGACYGCVVPSLGEDSAAGWARVCTEGPVFPAERIDWNRLRPEITAD